MKQYRYHPLFSNTTCDMSMRVRNGIFSALPNILILHSGSPDFTPQTDFSPGPGVADQASEYIIYKIGLMLQIYYLPVVVAVGMCGNILSFLVMSLVSSHGHGVVQITYN